MSALYAAEQAIIDFCLNVFKQRTRNLKHSNSVLNHDLTKRELNCKIFLKISHALGVSRVRITLPTRFLTRVTSQFAFQRYIV